MKTSLSFPAINRPGSAAMRNLALLTVAAFAISLSLTMAAINGYWLWPAGAVGIAGVIWMFALKSTTIAA
jgi:hypothetical protein